MNERSTLRPWQVKAIEQFRLRFPVVGMGRILRCDPEEPGRPLVFFPSPPDDLPGRLLEAFCGKGSGDRAVRGPGYRHRRGPGGRCR